MSLAAAVFALQIEQRADIRGEPVPTRFLSPCGVCLGKVAIERPTPGQGPANECKACGGLGSVPPSRVPNELVDECSEFLEAWSVINRIGFDAWMATGNTPAELFPRALVIFGGELDRLWAIEQHREAESKT